MEIFRPHQRPPFWPQVILQKIFSTRICVQNFVFLATKVNPIMLSAAGSNKNDLLHIQKIIFTGSDHFRKYQISWPFSGKWHCLFWIYILTRNSSVLNYWHFPGNSQVQDCDVTLGVLTENNRNFTNVFEVLSAYFDGSGSWDLLKTVLTLFCF